MIQVINKMSLPFACTTKTGNDLELFMFTRMELGRLFCQGVGEVEEGYGGDSILLHAC